MTEARGLSPIASVGTTFSSYDSTDRCFLAVSRLRMSLCAPPGSARVITFDSEQPGSLLSNCSLATPISFAGHGVAVVLPGLRHPNGPSFAVARETSSPRGESSAAPLTADLWDWKCDQPDTARLAAATAAQLPTVA